METAGLILTLLIFLAATAICVVLFERLGFGSVVGFIVAGVLIGPHTPGPVATSQVKELQTVSELGVILFLFAVGLEMQPRQFWAMRRALLGLGGAQVLLTALALGAVLGLMLDLHWQTTTIVALGLAMSSTAVVMTLLTERGELTTRYGRNCLSILMAQDLSVVPIMSLIPLLAHVATQPAGPALVEKTLLVAAALSGVYVLGRYALPKALEWAARYRSDQVFGILLFLCVIAAAGAVDQAGISMTLGAFLLGMLLSASDYRYQIAALIAPFKGTLMGLFFIAIGMSIDLRLLLGEWHHVLMLVGAVLVIKTGLVVLLCRSFRDDWQVSVRTGFSLCQVGEFAFVLLSVSSDVGLVSQRGASLCFLVISISMMLTPPMVRLGDAIASRIGKTQTAPPSEPAQDMSDHLVVVGLDSVGSIIALMAEKCGVPYVAFDRDDGRVRLAKQAGRNAHFGDILYPPVQQAAGIARARAAFVSTTDAERLRAVALFLRQRYPTLDVYARVLTLDEETYLRGKGIKHAGTVFLESTLFRGESLLKDMGIPEEQAKNLVESLRRDDFDLIRVALSVNRTAASPA